MTRPGAGQNSQNFRFPLIQPLSFALSYFTADLAGAKHFRPCEGLSARRPGEQTIIPKFDLNLIGGEIVSRPRWP